MQPPASRNAPCPCGSSKRFKDCHGAIGANDSPDLHDAEALFHRANREREQGHHAAAIALYEQALVLAPGHAGLLNNLGLALEAAGEPLRAEACYRKVLAADPNHSDALANLGNVLSQREATIETIAVYDRLFAIRHNFPPAVWAQRAQAQQRSGDLAGAVASLREALRQSPDDTRLGVNLATLHLRQRRHADAEEALLVVLARDADHAYALSTLAYVRQQRCAWQGLAELHQRIRRLLDTDANTGQHQIFNPFPLLAMPTTPRQQLLAAQRWASGFAPPVRAHAPRGTRAPGERLQVGFVSSDFRPHATTDLLMELWERLDRERFETFAYGISPIDDGSIGQRVRRAFEHCSDLSGESNSRVAARIRDDRIAILIDLNGYTRFAREGIFSSRPAPLQINAFGYLGTLGAEWYDRVLTDRFVSPPQAQADFSERFLYLDGCYCPSDTRREIAPDAGDRAAHGLPAAAFVFTCFNNSYKILSDTFAVWMRLLSAVPQGVLWLTETVSDTADNLRREAAAAGIDPSRLVFAPRLPLARHLARIAHADLFLDTTPYNAGATANDALFIGLPVVTCTGDTMSSRVAGSQLSAIGLPELATGDLRAYEAVALAAAREPALMRGYRDRLRAGRHDSPLFDMARYARVFEDAMLRAWDEQSGSDPGV